MRKYVNADFFKLNTKRKLGGPDDLELNSRWHTSSGATRLISVLLLAVVFGAGSVIFLGRTFSQGNPHKTRIDGELITIRSTGFEPKTLSRPMGRFFLFVDNRSGLETVNIRLDRVAGNRMVDVVTPKEKVDSAHLLDLTPGDYRLTEAAHPDWVCTITITAH